MKRFWPWFNLIAISDNLEIVLFFTLMYKVNHSELDERHRPNSLV